MRLKVVKNLTRKICIHFVRAYLSRLSFSCAVFLPCSVYYRLELPLSKPSVRAQEHTKGVETLAIFIRRGCWLC